MEEVDGAGPFWCSKFQVKWEITVFGVEEHPPQTGCFRVFAFAERRIFDRGFESLLVAARSIVAE